MTTQRANQLHTPTRTTAAIKAWLAAIALACTALTAAAQPVSGETRDLGRQTADRAIQYLRDTQDTATGGWSHAPADSGRPNLPAITALATTGLLLDPRIDHTDPDVARAIGYVLSFRQPDGGIYDQILPSYNTAIALSMLAMVQTPEAAAAIERARPFLLGLQYHEGFAGSPGAADFNEPVPQSHPFYGGLGYGRNGRPDASNLNFFLQALHDTGMPTTDPAFERALVFLSRIQMNDQINDQPYADGSAQGGFIYATVPDRESIDGFAGQSQAGMIELTREDGTVVSELRAYGSMTYAGFKSLIYANLPPDDPRVESARAWIEANYTVDENPGLGAQGQYYQYLAMARALDAWGDPTIAGQDWREDLIRKLSSLQEPDGSFRSLHPRWMEDNPELITAYSLIALQLALH